MLNFQKVYAAATEQDKAVAIASYHKYRKLTTDIAAKHGFDSKVGAAVFSALSPNNDYWGNLRDVGTLLAAAAAGKAFEDFNVSTYDSNKRKAWRIAHGEDPDALIVALKTRSFFHNVYDPDDPEYVTIDGHLYNIFHGVRRPLQSRNNKDRVVKVTKRDYVVIAGAVKDYATCYGLIPCQMQAILWQTWRRIHFIRTPAQREMWDRDFLAAGLGFVCA